MNNQTQIKNLGIGRPVPESGNNHCSCVILAEEWDRCVVMEQVELFVNLLLVGLLSMVMH